MKLHPYTVNIIAALICAFIVTGCGGGGGSFDSPDTDLTSDIDVTPDTPSFTLLQSAASATSLTGPLVYQTGDIAIGGASTPPGTNITEQLPFSYIIDTETNTISDGFAGTFTPRVVYDDLGRGVLIDQFIEPDSFVTVAYNDDNTIASTETTREGEVIIETVFIYDGGRLVGKEAVSDSFTRNITYNYTEDDTLLSSEEVLVQGINLTTTTTDEYTVDALGRVTEVLSFGVEDELLRRTTVERDINGNIIAIEDITNSILGENTQTATYNYAASNEPAVHVLGLLSALSDTFIPIFVPSFGLVSSN